MIGLLLKCPPSIFVANEHWPIPSFSSSTRRTSIMFLHNMLTFTEQSLRSVQAYAYNYNRLLFSG